MRWGRVGDHRGAPWARHSERGIVGGFDGRVHGGLGGRIRGDLDGSLLGDFARNLDWNIVGGIDRNLDWSVVIGGFYRNLFGDLHRRPGGRAER